MGDKVAAREVARAAGVPDRARHDGPGGRLRTPRSRPRDTGYPVMIKAAAGGGGRGIRVVADEDALRAAFGAGPPEAEKAFGDGTMYLERFVERARHVEVQVLGDGTDAVHLFERECSLQRRRQKVVEEAVSPGIPESVRDAMTTAAVKLCREVGYTSAGTVEFLVDDETQEFFFIEMNTRIQVEHPTTELVTGVDLVAEQLRIAAGERLRLTQDGIERRGHAIEYRVNAEDPTQDFSPQPGHVGRVTLPSGPWVRCDTWLEPDGTVPPFYDSLLAKVVVWGSDRDEALARSRRALDEFSVSGIPTTAGLLRSLVDEPWVAAGATSTRRRPAERAERRKETGMSARYSWGGDEFIFVELAEEMSLQANFKAVAITNLLREERPDGILEICPANASYQVRYDPDVLEPYGFLEHLKVGGAGRRRARGHAALPGRRDPGALPGPVDDRDADAVPGPPPGPGRHRHRVRGPDQRVRRRGGVHRRRIPASPWFTSMVGFVAGLPFKYQMVPRERQIAVPEVRAPAHGHPEADGRLRRLLLVHLLGARRGRLPDVRDHPGPDLRPAPDQAGLRRPHGVHALRGHGQVPADRPRRVRRPAGQGRSRRVPDHRTDVEFDLQPFLDDPDGYNKRLLEVLA